MKNKILSFLLVMIMVMCLIPAKAFAEPPYKVIFHSNYGNGQHEETVEEYKTYNSFFDRYSLDTDKIHSVSFDAPDETKMRVGWNTKPDNSGEDVINLFNTEGASDMDVYAIWGDIALIVGGHKVSVSQSEDGWYFNEKYSSNYKPESSWYGIKDKSGAIVLTLNNYNGGPIKILTETPVKLELIGTNTVTATTGNAINSTVPVTIIGDGKLIAKSDDSAAFSHAPAFDGEAQGSTNSDGSIPDAEYNDSDIGKYKYVMIKSNTDNKAAEAVVEKINEIGTVAYTAESKAKIDVARTAYNALTADQKKLVTKEQLKVLTDAEDTYAKLKSEADKVSAAKAAVDKINAIGKVVYTNKCKGKIDVARTAYNALTADQKKLVTKEQLKVLTDAEYTYAKLKSAAEKVSADKAAAKVAVDKINAIGKVVYTNKCKDKIDVARTAYNALTADQKKFVTKEQLKVLTDAENTYVKLKAAADKRVVKAAVDKINAIGKVVYTDKCKGKINAARTAYNALTAAQKKFVTKEQLKVLTDAENTYAKLKAADEKAKFEASKPCITTAKAGDKKISYSWTKVNGAAYYKVYFTKCGGEYKVVKTTTKTSFVKTGLKKGTKYKMHVKAYKKNGKYIKTSKTNHLVTKGGNNSNITSLTLKASNIRMSVNKTYTIKVASVKKDGNKTTLAKGHIAKYRYVATKNGVVTVSSTGKITAKKAGTAIVYVIAPSGSYKTVTVTVK